MCACACSARLGLAGRPPGRVLVRLIFSCGHFVLPLCSAHSGLGSPCLLWCFVFFFRLCAPVVSGIPCFPARGSLGLGVLFALPFFLSFLFFLLLSALLFFVFLLCVLFMAFFFVFFFRCSVCFFFPAALFVVLFLSLLCGAGSVCLFVAVVCAGLWCVVCFAWSCVACLCLAGFSSLAVRRVVALGLVGLFLLFSAVACCCALCCFVSFALFRAFPWWSVLFWSVWCSAVVRPAVWRGPVALFLCWLLLRYAV